MTHDGITGSNNRDDILDTDVIFCRQRMSQIIDISDYGLMHRRQRTADAGKNHPGDNIFAVTRLQIMTTFDADDFAGFEIDKLNNNRRGADIDGEAVLLIGGIASFDLQDAPDAIMTGVSNGDLPMMSAQFFSQILQAGQGDFIMIIRRYFMHFPRDPINVRSIVLKSGDGQLKIDLFYNRVKGENRFVSIAM